MHKGNHQRDKTALGRNYARWSLSVETPQRTRDQDMTASFGVLMKVLFGGEGL